MISWELGVVTEYSRWARAARQGVRLQLLQLGDAIINLSVPLKPLAVKLHCETKIAPSRSHVIRQLSSSIQHHPSPPAAPCWLCENGPANGGLCVSVCAAGWEPCSEERRAPCLFLFTRNNQVFYVVACNTCSPGRRIVFSVMSGLMIFCVAESCFVKAYNSNVGPLDLFTWMCWGRIFKEQLQPRDLCSWKTDTFWPNLLSCKGGPTSMVRDGITRFCLPIITKWKTYFCSEKQSFGCTLFFWSLQGVPGSSRERQFITTCLD